MNDGITASESYREVVEEADLPSWPVPMEAREELKEIGERIRAAKYLAQEAEEECDNISLEFFGDPSTENEEKLAVCAAKWKRLMDVWIGYRAVIDEWCRSLDLQHDDEPPTIIEIGELQV